MKKIAIHISLLILSILGYYLVMLDGFKKALVAGAARIVQCVSESAQGAEDKGAATPASPLFRPEPDDLNLCSRP